MAAGGNDNPRSEVPESMDTTGGERTPSPTDAAAGASGDATPRPGTSPTDFEMVEFASPEESGAGNVSYTAEELGIQVVQTDGQLYLLGPVFAQITEVNGQPVNVFNPFVISPDVKLVDISLGDSTHHIIEITEAMAKQPTSNPADGLRISYTGSAAPAHPPSRKRKPGDYLTTASAGVDAALPLVLYTRPFNGEEVVVIKRSSLDACRVTLPLGDRNLPLRCDVELVEVAGEDVRNNMARARQLLAFIRPEQPFVITVETDGLRPGDRVQHVLTVIAPPVRRVKPETAAATMDSAAGVASARVRPVRLGSIGLTFGTQDGAIVVQSVAPNGAAARYFQGGQYDHIIGAKLTSVGGYMPDTLDQANQAVRGEIGESCIVMLAAGGDEEICIFAEFCADLPAYSAPQKTHDTPPEDLGLIFEDKQEPDGSKAVGVRVVTAESPINDAFIALGVTAEQIPGARLIGMHMEGCPVKCDTALDSNNGLCVGVTLVFRVDGHEHSVKVPDPRPRPGNSVLPSLFPILGGLGSSFSRVVPVPSLEDGLGASGRTAKEMEKYDPEVLEMLRATMAPQEFETLLREQGIGGVPATIPAAPGSVFALANATRRSPSPSGGVGGPGSAA
jgi:hypothetical protein